MFVISRNTAFTYKEQAGQREADRPRAGRPLCTRRERPAIGQPGPRQRATGRCRDRRASLGGAVRPRHGRSVRLAKRDHWPDRDHARPRADRCGGRPSDRASRRAGLHSPGTRRNDRSRTRPRTYAEAISLFERALALDPRSVEAQSRLASALVARVLDGMTDSPAADLARAEELVGQALAASPRVRCAHHVKGQVLRAQRRYEEAIPEYETVIAFDRNWVGALCASRPVQVLHWIDRGGDPAGGASHPPQPPRSLASANGIG